MSSNNIKRILLKLSGEALLGDHSFGVDPKILDYLAGEIQSITTKDVELGIVIGGGNIFRGEGLAQSGIDRVTGDQMGMLATIINALAIQDALERQGMYARVMSALKVNEVCEDYIRRRATRHLEKGRITIFAAGTGNPYFTTDSAASLRAVEIEADLLIKATRVNSVFSDDPLKNQDADHYDKISYDDFISMRLKVMDTTSIVMCRDNDLPVRVYDMGIKGALLDIVEAVKEGKSPNEYFKKFNEYDSIIDFVFFNVRDNFSEDANTLISLLELDNSALSPALLKECTGWEGDKLTEALNIIRRSPLIESTNISDLAHYKLTDLARRYIRKHKEQSKIKSDFDRTDEIDVILEFIERSDRGLI